MPNFTVLVQKPFVIAGDDVTFVCDGRLGISLATRYVEKFEEYTKNKIRDDIGQFLWTATKRRPMVLPVIIEV